MRVGIVSTPFLPIPPKKYGGTERVIYHLVKGLKELGHEVILFAPADSEIDCEIIPISEKSYFHHSDLEEDKELQPLRDEATKNTLKLVRENLHRLDIIHSHGADLLEFKDFPNVTTLHGPIILSKMDYYEERKELYYISISKNQQEAFPDLQYVGTVYNSLDSDPFDYVETPEDYLVFLGRFDREKNPHLAIQLAIKLGIKLKLAGKIDFQGLDYFKQECEPFFDNPLIEFMGEIDTPQKAILLGNAKCNLHPTGFREPFGLTVLESAYCGTPTMAIHRGSMPELIEEGRTGILVEDFDEGYHRIEECFLMDRNYISQRAKLLFNYTNMAKQYVLAYEKVIHIFNEKTNQDKTVTQKILTEARAGLQLLWENLVQNEKGK